MTDVSKTIASCGSKTERVTSRDNPSSLWWIDFKRHLIYSVLVQVRVNIFFLFIVVKVSNSWIKYFEHNG